MPIPSFAVPQPVRPSGPQFQTGAPGYRRFGVQVGVPDLDAAHGRQGFDLTGGGAAPSFTPPAPVVPAQADLTRGVAAPAGQPRPVLDRLSNMWGIGRDFAASERGGSTLYGIAAGMQGIEQPATSAIGSFARGFSQAIVGSMGLRASKAEAANTAAQTDIENRRADERLALDTRTADRADATARAEVENTRLDNERLTASLTSENIGRVNTALDQFKRTLTQHMQGSSVSDTTAAFTPTQQIEFDRQVEQERARLLRMYALPEDLGNEGGATPAAGPEAPAMDTPNAPYGGQPVPTPPRAGEDPVLRGSGTALSPYYGWITTEQYAAWPVGTVFYNPADGVKMVK